MYQREQGPQHCSWMLDTGDDGELSRRVLMVGTSKTHYRVGKVHGYQNPVVLPATWSLAPMRASFF